MPKTKKITIDGDALKAEIQNKGLTFTEASNAIGCGGSYLNNIIKRGELPYNKQNVIESQLGISPDLYVVKEETQLEIEAPAYNVPCDMGDLSDQIAVIIELLECLCLKAGVYPEWLENGNKEAMK